MISKSLENFVSTYMQLTRLVFYREKKQLIIIAVGFLFSFAFLGLAFVITLTLLKSIIVGGDYKLIEPIEVSYGSWAISFSKLRVTLALLMLYFLSSFSMYIAEKRWYAAIQKIVTKLVQSNEQTRDVRRGAIATIRVSGILLNIISPVLIALVAFILLLFFNIKMAIFTIIMTGIAAYSYLNIGRNTKQISNIQADDDDVCEPSANQNVDVVDRLEFLSNLFQLKAKSKLIANLLFTLCVVAAIVYFLNISTSTISTYDLAVSVMFVLLCFNGFKVVGSKVVPLSRQYNLVRVFILATNTKLTNIDYE